MKTWHTLDKSDWPDGPWKTEPDKAQWIDEKSGLDCLITRVPHGSLCGYVGIPKTHPLFNKDYHGLGLRAHGGVNFAEACDPDASPDKGICHTGEVANETVWWFGFDCGHCFDLTPGMGALIKRTCPAADADQISRICGGGIYRDFDYVKQKVESLAEQLQNWAATGDH